MVVVEVKLMMVKVVIVVMVVILVVVMIIQTIYSLHLLSNAMDKAVISVLHEFFHLDLKTTL